jgi:hypothetical protein
VCNQVLIVDCGASQLTAAVSEFSVESVVVRVYTGLTHGLIWPMLCYASNLGRIRL